MKTLGAILAGGKARRFGSDKAEALLHGRPLIEHAFEALRPHCDALVIVGRSSPLAPSVEDWPGPDMGPLGGIGGALDHALRHGFDLLLTSPVDCVRLPAELRAMLDPAPACLADQPVIGLWPARAAGALEELLFSSARHSVYGFAERIGARMVETGERPVNINTPEDLKGLERRG
ncbi:MAG: molybdenum cofactor guanylyltransferase [Sphingomonas sp.]|uniref:molybdenum cofactor guanylyltransferase n=1 Tax=Sphingomonas sp. TaxID=28214 RepID=UPI001B18CF46|nr:molybdenum cofactor guanylyltransferase [Sphingomonas sp.]MBO9622531.1 molybdenum cofactor guanylyltransferase [Sphingomonas sp.]